MLQKYSQGKMAKLDMSYETGNLPIISLDMVDQTRQHVNKLDNKTVCF